MIKKILFISMILSLVSLVTAQASGVNQGLDTSDPTKTVCTGSGIYVFTCNIMKTLLLLGPMIAVLAIVIGGVIYVYASVFVTADQRGKYHTLATNLVIGALILAALVGGAGVIINVGKTLLQTG